MEQQAAVEPDAEQAALDEQWMMVAMRPDLYGEPGEGEDAQQGGNDAAPGPDEAMKEELAEATAGSPVEARVEPGSPVMLQPTQPPEPAATVVEAEEAGGAPLAAPGGTPETSDQAAGDSGDASAGAAHASGDASAGAGDAPAGAADRAAAATKPPVPEAASHALSDAPGAAGDLPGAAGNDAPALALTSGVEEPNPQRIAQQIPQTEITFEDFLHLVTAPRSEAEDRQEIQQAQAELSAFAEQEKTAILAEAEMRKAAVQAEADNQLALIEGALSNHLATLEQSIQAATQQAAGLAEQKKAAIRTRLAQDIEQVQAASQGRKEQFSQELDSRRDTFRQFIDESKQVPVRFAESEAARAAQELGAAGNEAISVGESTAARYPGDSDQRPAQRQAAQQTAQQSRDDIVSKKTEIRAELLAKAEETTGNYDQYLTTVLGEIDQTHAQAQPGFDSAEQSATEALNQAADQTLQQIDQEEAATSQALQELEARAGARLRADGDQSRQQVRDSASAQIAQLDEMAAAAGAHVDNAVAEAEQHVAGLDNPFVPGVLDLFRSVRDQVAQIAEESKTQIAAAGQDAVSGLDEIGGEFTRAAAHVVAGAAEAVTERVGQSQATLDQAEQEYAAGKDAALAGMETALQELTDGTLEALDAGLQDARDRIEQSNAKVNEDITRAATDSIAEAKKPLTDPLPDRCRAAAEKAGEPWWKGALRAVGQIVVGFVILVAVAALVVLVAAAFSVSLTLMGAMLVAGAILLVVGAGVSAYKRRGAGDSWRGAMGKGLVDATGVTGLYQAVTNNDLFTGQDLQWSDADRWEHGILGGVTLVGLLAGVRGALRGPLVRNTGMPRGWGGWRTAAANMRRDMGFFRVDLATMARNLYLGLRYGRTRVSAPAGPLRNRARLRVDTRRAVNENAPRDANGHAIDPNTHQPITRGNENFGHRYGHEWLKFRNDPANRNMSRPEVLDAQNNPDIYYLEDGASNVGHAWEQDPSTLRGYPIIPDPDVHQDPVCPQ